MKPFIMRDVPNDRLALFKRIRRTVRWLPEPDLGRDDRGRPVLLSCHMLCRALAAHFPVTCKDGCFGPGHATHSWLDVGDDLLVDPYPWATLGGPLLVYVGGMSPQRFLYRETDLSDHFAGLRPSFDRHVAQVTEAVRRVLLADEPRYDF